MVPEESYRNVVELVLQFQVSELERGESIYSRQKGLVAEHRYYVSFLPTRGTQFLCSIVQTYGLRSFASERRAGASIHGVRPRVLTD